MSDGVLDGRFDIAVQRLPSRDARLATRPWWNQPLALFLPSAHPLAHAPDPAPLTALGRIPLVLWPRESSPHSHDEILALCDQAGVTPRIGARARSVQTVLALVAAGFGGAVMPDSHRALRRIGVAARPLTGTNTTLYLVWRADDTDPLVHRFKDTLAALTSRPCPTDHGPPAR
ncbi:hypothetical protein F8568_046520, partial [Actinomadura sp. LD22]